MSNIRYLNATTVLASTAATQYVDLPTSEFDWVTSEALWTVRDRGRAQRCLEAISQGVVDYVGLPRVEVPAEYVAAVIVKFVKPVNWLLACSYMEGCPTVIQTIHGEPSTITASVLFAHCIALADGDVSALLSAERAHMILGGANV